MIDVVALGECLIDFTPNGENTQGIALFARNPGGAPANVLAMNACLGGKTAFIGKVGKDGFGDFLRQTLIDNVIEGEEEKNRSAGENQLIKAFHNLILPALVFLPAYFFRFFLCLLF